MEIRRRFVFVDKTEGWNDFPWNIEIIMIDDGSLDNCGIKCDQYAAKDLRVRVIHKKNAGLGMARNAGLDIAQGQYVMHLFNTNVY